jgi:hypothetical protein
MVADAGCSSNLPAKASNGSTSLPFPVVFLGNTYNSVWVNTDGNVTFGPPGGTPTSGGLPNSVPIIAPFYATADASPPGAVTYGTISFGGRTAFCVDWSGVASTEVSGVRNSFQLLLVDRSDVNPGNFDAIFDYDQIQWDQTQSAEMFCMDPADPTTCGPVPHFADVGYASNAQGAVGFDMPRSGEPGVFLDSNTDTGLIHSSSGSLQLGRYRFEFRGVANTAVVQGVVKNAASGAGLAGADVQICWASGCLVTISSNSGNYAFLGLAGGNYTVTAFPPPGSSMSKSVTVTGLAAAETRTVDIALPTPIPMPAGSTLTPTVNMVFGVPTVHWQSPLVLTTNGCPGATATWEVRQNGVVVPGLNGAMSEGPAGTYRVSIAPVKPTHGASEIVMHVICPGGSTSTVDFNIYIDPSGVVKDTNGAVVPGATVTLFRSDQVGGPFTQVPNGNALMSPGNRTNPDVADASGHFGWDVIAGFYRVRAQKAGCTDPASPGQAFVETAVLTIPPPVTTLELVLACPMAAPDFTPLTPSRILDTRNGTGGVSAKVGPASAVDVGVTGVGGVPPSGVGAVVLNVTVTEPTDQSWLTVFPAGQLLPLASNLNFVAGENVPNLVVAKVGTGGKVTVYNSAGSTHVIFDVVGWFGG